MFGRKTAPSMRTCVKCGHAVEDELAILVLIMSGREQQTRYYGPECAPEHRFVAYGYHVPMFDSNMKFQGYEPQTPTYYRFVSSLWRNDSLTIVEKMPQTYKPAKDKYV